MKNSITNDKESTVSAINEVNGKIDVDIDAIGSIDITTNNLTSIVNENIDNITSLQQDFKTHKSDIAKWATFTISKTQSIAPNIDTVIAIDSKTPYNEEDLFTIDNNQIVILKTGVYWLEGTFTYGTNNIVFCNSKFLTFAEVFPQALVGNSYVNLIV